MPSSVILTMPCRNATLEGGSGRGGLGASSGAQGVRVGADGAEGRSVLMPRVYAFPKTVQAGPTKITRNYRFSKNHYKTGWSEKHMGDHKCYDQIYMNMQKSVIISNYTF